MTKKKAIITGVQGYVPDYILTNQELETMVNTSDDWIVSRTGIKERRILKEEGLGTSHMAVIAVKKLLEKTNVNPEEIELIICATVTPDFYSHPATANIISHEVGAHNAYGYDLVAACSSFINALATASQFIETGKHKKVIVAGADKMSSIVDYQDRKTCVLFGDGAGAVLLEASEDENEGVQDYILKTDGVGIPMLQIKAGGSRKPTSYDSIEAREHYMYQEGSSVYKYAVNSMANVSIEILEKNNLHVNDVNWLVPHQANKRIIKSTVDSLKLPEEKVMYNIHKYGNTTNASMPLCLWEYEPLLKKGDNIILTAFGAGFTWGSIYIKWAYNS